MIIISPRHCNTGDPHCNLIATRGTPLQPVATPDRHCNCLGVPVMHVLRIVGVRPKIPRQPEFASTSKHEGGDNRTNDGNLEAQLNTLESMRSKCALNAIKLENWQYAALLLIHLPESYRHISDSFLTTGKIDQLDTAAVTAKIIETEIRRKAESTARPVLATAPSKS